MTTVFKPPIVVDTNVILSAMLFPRSLPREVLTHALNTHQLVFSARTWDELSFVLQRSKFERYLPLEKRLLVLANLASKVSIVHSTTLVTDCRDPKDNKFLALALDAGATTLVTGDIDLLVLHPYRGISICAPAGFLSSLAP